jgi:sterol desaturase/sphingolipid hydroxylase (fatty acid hydroxylase superfamily)
MEILQTVIDQIKSFFGMSGLIDIIKSNNYQALLTYKGITSALQPLLQIVLILELVRGLLYRKFKIINYKIPFLSYILNAILGRYISIGMTVVMIGLLEKYAILHISFTWYWLIYGYIIWEFAHFIYHYLGHKVRLFWCLHSTHHAPESMNLSISYSHFFLEGPYADLIRTSICILAGVPPPMLFVIMFIDGFWGSFIHIGDTVLKDARLGFLGKLILTPSHHRVHHAKNPIYMDTNYCNLLNIWDRIFKTYQLELKEVPVEYGITRTIKPNDFLDAYFGEFSALAKDIYNAPGIVNKILYIFMPPGWSHTGDHKTSKVMRERFLTTQNKN